MPTARKWAAYVKIVSILPADARHARDIVSAKAGVFQRLRKSSTAESNPAFWYSRPIRVCVSTIHMSVRQYLLFTGLSGTVLVRWFTFGQMAFFTPVCGLEFSQSMFPVRCILSSRTLDAPAPPSRSEAPGLRPLSSTGIRGVYNDD
jgi:hypothetical protein